MHYDNFDNLYAQIIGKKKFILVEPGQSHKMVYGRLRKAYCGLAAGQGEAGDLEGGVDKFVRNPDNVVRETVINYLPFELEDPDFDVSPLFNRSKRYVVPPPPAYHYHIWTYNPRFCSL